MVFWRFPTSHTTITTTTTKSYVNVRDIRLLWMCFQWFRHFINKYLLRKTSHIYTFKFTDSLSIVNTFFHLVFDRNRTKKKNKNMFVEFYFCRFGIRLIKHVGKCYQFVSPPNGLRQEYQIAIAFSKSNRPIAEVTAFIFFLCGSERIVHVRCRISGHAQTTSSEKLPIEARGNTWMIPTTKNRTAIFVSIPEVCWRICITSIGWSWIISVIPSRIYYNV